MDADLQDPPEVVLELVARWREGYEVVYAVREARERRDGVQARDGGWFYRAFDGSPRSRSRSTSATSGSSTGARSTRSTRCARATASSAACSAGSGSSQTGVVYERTERFAGETKYPLPEDRSASRSTALISFSAAPLRLALNVGFFVSFVSFRPRDLERSS